MARHQQRGKRCRLTFSRQPAVRRLLEGHKGCYEFRGLLLDVKLFYFSSRRRHPNLQGDWSSDVCSSDLYSKGRRASRYPIFPPEHRPRSLRSKLPSKACENGDAPDRKSGAAVHPVTWQTTPELVPKIGRASCRERV